MKLPWKNEQSDDAGASTDAATAAPETDVDDSTEQAGRKITPGKGRPTPKRREAQARRRGPVAPAPMTRAEARARKKATKTKLTKEQRKEQNEQRRNLRQRQREGMMAGEEKYLMPRDKGPVRGYARDIVDSRRNLAGLFMPFAILLIVTMFIPVLAVYMTYVMLVVVLFLAIDGYFLGRIVNRRVRERYPDTQERSFPLGWYAFTRSMQMRFMRAPKPQVSAGEAV